MGLLPDIDEGGKLKLHTPSDDDNLRPVLALLPRAKKAQVDHMMANEGFSLRKALEQVGVMICER